MFGTVLTDDLDEINRKSRVSSSGNPTIDSEDEEDQSGATDEVRWAACTLQGPMLLALLLAAAS